MSYHSVPAVFLPHGAVHLPFGIPLGHGIPLIIGFLTLTQAQLYFTREFLKYTDSGISA